MKNAQRSNKLSAMVLLLGTLIWTSLSVAQSAGEAPMSMFEAQGIMRFIDLPSAVVQIDDTRYKLSPVMRWAGLDPNENLMRQLLRALNGPVAYAIDSKQKTPTVKAIWVLPVEGR